MPAGYQVYKDTAGKFRFRLRAGNNKVMATGEAYETHAGCLNGIKSIQKNCKAKTEDLTIEGKKIANPKYQVFKDATSKFRFRLNASNGATIAVSEAYETKEECLNGIKLVKKHCNAEIEHLKVTREKKQETVEAQPSTTTAVIETKKLPPKPAPIEVTKPPPAKAREEIVFVGKKMTMDYVQAIIIGMSARNAKEITLRARGKAIPTAVDAAEITMRRALKDVRIGEITIGTEKMPPKQGETRPRMVSTIEIKLKRD